MTIFQHARDIIIFRAQDLRTTAREGWWDVYIPDRARGLFISGAWQWKPETYLEGIPAIRLCETCVMDAPDVRQHLGRRGRELTT